MKEERDYENKRLDDVIVFRYELLLVLKEISHNIDQIRLQGPI